MEPFVFKPEGLRDPFKPITITEEETETAAGSGNGIRPDTSRRKEELEAFPLDSLRMVGTVVMKTNLWALVKASDKTIYRVRVGNYMGKNYGKIIRILADKIGINGNCSGYARHLAGTANFISFNRVILRVTNEY